MDSTFLYVACIVLFVLCFFFDKFHFRLLYDRIWDQRNDMYVCMYVCMCASTGSSDKGEHRPYLEAGDKPITKS